MVLKNERIGLTGASGLLGRHIISYFLKKNAKILATSRNKPSITHKNLIWKKLDLNKKIKTSELDKIYKKTNHIIHAGAFVPSPGQKRKKKWIENTNIYSAFDLAYWARKTDRHFIFVSGAALYKENNKKNYENSKLLENSKNMYVKSKIDSEKKILRLKNNNFKLTIVRPSSLYGHGMNIKKIIPLMIQKAKKGEIIEIINPHKTKINLIHAKDISSAIFKIIRIPQYGIYNLGNDKCTNFYNIAKTIVRLLKSKSKIVIKNNNFFLNTVNSLNVKINLAKNKLKWTPKINLEKGLKMMVKEKCL